METIEPRKLVIELAAAVLLNVVAGVITYFFTRQVTYALVAAIVVEMAVIIAMYVRLKSKPKLVGITDSAPTFAEGPDIVTIAQTVSTEFAFWGISAKSMLSDDRFRDVMVRKAKGNCEFRFMLLNPNSPYVAKKALEEGDTAAGWKNEIEANIMRLKQLRDEHHLNIEVRVYDQFPVFRVIFTNSNKMYFGWYPVGLQGIRSPLLIVENSQGALYQPVRLSFNDLWVRAENPYDDLNRANGVAEPSWT